MQTITGFEEKPATIFIKLSPGSADRRYRIDER
jgi:hypothetical protein